MPCLTDYRNDYDVKRDQNHARVEAALCAILTCLETHDQLTKVLSKANWEEAGVTRKQVVSWWTDHKAKDAVRKQKELADKKNREKAQRLSKMPWEDLTTSQRQHILTWSK